MRMSALLRVWTERTVESVGIMRTGVTFRRFRLNSRMADVEIFMQPGIERENDRLTLRNGAGIRQDDVTGKEMQTVADSPDMQVMDIADRPSRTDHAD